MQKINSYFKFPPKLNLKPYTYYGDEANPDKKKENENDLTTLLD